MVYSNKNIALTAKTYTISGTVTGGPAQCTSMLVDLKVGGTTIKSGVSVVAVGCSFSVSYTYAEHATTTETLTLDIQTYDGYTSTPKSVSVTEPVTSYTT